MKSPLAVPLCAVRVATAPMAGRPEQTAGIHAVHQSGLGNLKQMLEGR